MTDPNVFEHANRNDPVEPLVDVSIVLQQKSGVLAQSPLRGSLISNRMLFFGQRYAGNIGSPDFCKIESETAPAASDVEYALIAVNSELRRDMPLLGKLRIVERGVRRFEVGAAVLPIGIQEKGVETAVEVVVMRDVATGSFARVELGEASPDEAEQPSWQSPFRRFDALREQHGKYVGNRALLDHQGTIHIGVAEFEFGVTQQA